MKREIINKLARNRVVESIIKNIAHSTDEDFVDLAQDIYTELLIKDEETIKYLYDKNSLENYIYKMVRKSIFSKTSRFYYKYRKHKKIELKLDNDKENF